MPLDRNNMPRASGRHVALALAVTALVTFFDLGTVKRSLSGASQSRNLNIHDEVQLHIHNEVQQQAEELQEEQANLESTIVTAYFELPGSKHKHSEYMIWATRALCINDPLVIFTQLKFVDEFLRVRSHATNRTLIVPIDLEDIEVGDTLHYPNEFWNDTTKFWNPRWRGSAKHLGLYKIWLAKSWFVNQAIQMNPFNSSLYSWMDIGHMREGRHFCEDTVVRHPEIVPDDGRIMLFMNRDMIEGDIGHNSSIFFGNSYIAGGFISGRVDAWPLWMSKLEKTIPLYLAAKGKFLNNDQAIMQTTCMRNPGLCAVTRPHDKYRGFFAAKFRFKNGKNICQWDPGIGTPLEGDPDYCEQ